MALYRKTLQISVVEGKIYQINSPNNFSCLGISNAGTIRPSISETLENFLTVPPKFSYHLHQSISYSATKANSSKTHFPI